MFNAHYDERCFLPIHVYDTDRSHPVAVVLRPGKTPSGVEVRAHLRRLVRRIRRPDKGLLMAATDETVDVDNPAHMAVARDSEAAVAPLNGLTMTTRKSCVTFIQQL